MCPIDVFNAEALKALLFVMCCLVQLSLLFQHRHEVMLIVYSWYKQTCFLFIPLIFTVLFSSGL